MVLNLDTKKFENVFEPDTIYRKYFQTFFGRNILHGNTFKTLIVHETVEQKSLKSNFGR